MEKGYNMPGWEVIVSCKADECSCDMGADNGSWFY